MRGAKSERARRRGLTAFPSKEGDIHSAISPTTGTTGVDSATGRSVAATRHAERPQAPASAVSLQAMPSSPPAEVLDAMARAGEVYERLSAQGRTLHFEYDPASRRASVEVRDSSGKTVGQLSLAQALDVAAGKTTE